MPPVKEHIKSSLKRTGKEYKELHEWMDYEYKNPSGCNRHDIANIAENVKVVEEKFGKDAVKEFLWHIKEDNDSQKSVVGSMKRAIGKLVRRMI